MTERSNPTRRMILSAAAAGLAAGPVLAASSDGVTVGPDGLFKQDWFLDTFLDMGEDLNEAAANGRGLIVLFEQEGCPYCRELHRVNFAKPELRDYLRAKFSVVQIDMFGSRETTDFDGEALEERSLARKWGVHFTPTTVLFPASAAGAATREAAEAFRLPGYLKPFHYLTALEFVGEGAYKEMDFQRYLQQKIADLKAKGIQADVW